MTRRARLPLTAIASTVLIAWIVRLWAEWGLSYGEPVSLFGGLFRLTLGENAGVAFGLLGGSPLVPWLAALALVTFVLYLARSLRGSRVGSVSFGLILGGGIANLLDRLNDGRVTDYLDVGLGTWRWPAFNLADVAITVSFLLVVRVLVGDGHTPPESATGHAPAGRDDAP